jgi:hypothetical protein
MRREVSVADVAAVLPHVLWGTEDEAGPVAAWVEERMVPEGGTDQLGFLLSSVKARAADRAEGGGWQGGAEAGSTGLGVAAGWRGRARSGAVGDEEAETMTDGAWEAEAGEDAVASDAALLADVSALADAALDSAAEMLSHAASVAAMREHLFLAPHTATALRQRLLPDTLRRAEALRGIASEAAALRLALQADAPSDAVRALLGKGGGAGELDGDELGWAGGEGGGEAGGGFSDEELAWGRKEAKARLQPEAFREWRKAVKKLK